MLTEQEQQELHKMVDELEVLRDSRGPGWLVATVRLSRLAESTGDDYDDVARQFLADRLSNKHRTECMKAKHPMQPIVWASDGVIRFKENKIISYLARSRLNEIAMLDFPKEDHVQLAQLIGYSVSGFGDLSYIPRKLVNECDEIAAQMSKKRKRKTR